MIHVKSFEVGPIAENTYVLYAENGDTAIVDCGVFFNKEKEQLLSFIKDNNLNVKMVLTTHMHFDHIFGNVWAKRQFGNSVPFYAPYKDIDRLPSIKDQLSRFMLTFNNVEELPKSAYSNISDGGILYLSTDEIQIIEVPGHSPGHLVFYIPSSKVVLSGDTLFYNSIGRMDLWGCIYDELISNIKNNLLVLPDDTVVWPGHGQSTTIVHEKNYNPCFY